MSMKSSIIVSAKLPISALFMTSVNLIPRAAVSFVLLAAALFLLPCSAFADFRLDSSYAAVQDAATGFLDLAAGSAIDGALQALGVKLAIGSGALLTTKDLIESVVSGAPLGVVGYEYQGSFYDLVDQSTIRIRDDVVTIDGVDYKDVWLPHDAAVKFRVNAFDFISFYNLVSESSGTYASGVGYYDGIPIYYSSSLGYSSPTYTSSNGISIGNVSASFVDNGSDSGTFRYLGTINTSAGTRSAEYQLPYSSFSGQMGLRATQSVVVYGPIANSGNITNAVIYQNSSLYVNSPFDFVWTSSVIPAQSFPESEGLRIRVPSSYVAGIPSTLDPSLPDYDTYLQSLSSAIEQARLADVVESTAFEDYDAPAPPVPSTGTIAEEPYSSLQGSLGGIQDSLDNIDTNIGTVDESLDDIQIYAEDAADSLQSIDTNLSQSVADTAGIKGFIQQYLPGVHSLLSSISSSVSDIAGSIAAADQTFFGNVVDAILAPFTPVFDIFKAGVGIWRYVVAWVGNISAPFSWIWSTLSRSNGILVSPILASAAAAVVLAVYKRFGR